MDFSAAELPIAPYLPRISELLAERRRLVLSAEPGAGKSTLVPPYLMDAGWLGGRKIVMLEPRRIAAVGVAVRIAELLGEKPGERAGYRTRSAACVGRATRIEVVTEALLTRRIQADPLLADTGLLIFDEFHERSIHADLALALGLEAAKARPELALLVMSATMDDERIAAFLEAPALACPGRSHPVQTRHQPLPERGRWEEAFSAALARLSAENPGDVLAFLPGYREIRRVGAGLAESGGGFETLSLHGSLPLEEQRRVLRPAAGASKRIILATSIAETSLTVPGVRTVADAGWSRISRFHQPTGLDRLVTERVSTASADQRRGRAARLGPGLCVRFWPEKEPLPPRPAPEILRSDLAGLVLECAIWGAREPAALSWLDPPPAPAWNQAGELLRLLGLLDGRGVATERGRRAAGLGLAPRLAVLVLAGAESGRAGLAAACAGLISERDGSGCSGDPDIRLRLEILRLGQGGGQAWRRAVAEECTRILGRLARGAAEGKPSRRRERLFAWSIEAETGVGSLLATAFPDRIGRREADGSYRFVSGRIARFGQPGSPAAAEWITVPEADAGESLGTIRLAAPLEPAEAERILAPIIEESIEVKWKGPAPKGVRLRRAGRLLVRERACRAPPEIVAASFLERLKREGLSILPWDDRSRLFLGRLRFYARRRPASPGQARLAALADDAVLAESAESWLLPRLDCSGGAVLDADGLKAALAGILAGRRADFESSVPESLTLPSGSRRRIDYSTDDPAVEARIQEVFGLLESPRICGVPLTFRLLSPAGRPLQITRDLAGFWRGTYAEVRKEMRGRYPKHYWPEDPHRAEAISGTRPKRRA